MARDAPPLIPMRDGANRVFGYAVLASILLHALLLLALPSLREITAFLPPAPTALIARVVRLPPPPAPAPAVEPRKPPPPEPRPQPPAASPAPIPAPVPAPTPTPDVQAAVPQPSRPVASEPAPASPATAITPAAPGPIARMEVRPAPPAPGSAAREHYRVSLNIAAARFKRYPRAAIDNNWEGEVVVLMTIGADGRIASLRVRSGSGYEILDRQALDMFRTAKPFVPIPPELRGREFELELRAIYSLRDQDSG